MDRSTSLAVVLCRLFSSKLPPYRAFRALLTLLLVFMLAKSGSDIAKSFEEPLIYRKDLLQDYLTARAVLEGSEPYRDISALKRELMPLVSQEVFSHPSPHPPVLVMLFVPLALGTYEAAALGWLCIQIGAFVLCMWIISRRFFEGLSPAARGLSLLLIVSSAPIYVDLMQGQVGVLLLLSVLLFEWSMEKKRDCLQGVFLGGMFAVKFFGAPLLLYFLLCRRWRVLIAALLSFAAFLAAAGWYFGLEALLYYFREVLPAVSLYYRPDPDNQSLWTLGSRLFCGMGLNAPGPACSPLAHLSWAAAPLSALFSVSCLIGGLWYAVRHMGERGAVNMLIPLSAVVTPLAWVHGLTVCLLPLLVVHRVLFDRGLPIRSSLFFFLLVAGLFLGHLPAEAVLGESQQVSFLPCALTFLPGLSTLGLVICGGYALRNGGKAGVKPC